MTAIAREQVPAGQVSLHVVRAGTPAPDPIYADWPSVTDDRARLDVSTVRRFAFPARDLPAGVNEWRLRNSRNVVRGLRRAVAARSLHIPTHFGALFGTVIRESGEVIPLGLMSMRVVTTAGVNAIVDAFQNTVELENFKFHGMGTGTNAEASSDTALQTELTTQYNPDNTRATGTTTEGASANIYRTVGTNTIDSGTPAVTEHGVFSAASSGTLLDRSVFSAINLASGDGIQFTYDLTFTAGG